MFMGTDGFVWFQGVVEDRADPLMLGRIRVRCLGWHTDDKNLIPTASLPWAHPMAPITSASMNGIGTTPLGPVEGTWVVGFFRDGKDAQEPVVMGTIGGIPEVVSDTTVGFNDPNGVYPAVVSEPDTNRLARGETRTATVNGTVDKPRETSVSVANGGTAWLEPEDPYAAVYPSNHVRESESGHIEEWDDTSTAERLHRYHKSGTREEIHPNGDRVVRVVGKDYEVIISDKNVLVKGSVNLTVDSDCRTYIKGDWQIQVDGDKYEHIVGDTTLIVGGDLDEVVTGDQTTAVGGDLDEVVMGDQTTAVTGIIDIDARRVYIN